MTARLSIAAALLCGAALSAGFANAEPRSRAADDYLMNCAGCHRFDGSGSRAVPSLKALEEVWVSAGGRQYFVRVPGVALAPLDDARLAAVLNYVLREFSRISLLSPYTASEVSTLRREPFLDPEAARRTVLAAGRDRP